MVDQFKREGIDAYELKKVGRPSQQINNLFVFYQAILVNRVCPVLILSDKGTQFFANTRNKNGERALSEFEKELNISGIELWTSRRNHP